FAKGEYTRATRSVVRWIASSGCPQAQIGGIVQRVASIFGVLVRKISRRAVANMIMEGGIASETQVAREMAQSNSQCLTISVDGTSHRKSEYEGQHVHLRVPDYESGQSVSCPISKPITRTLGVASALRKSADASLAGLKSRIEGMANTMRHFPSSQGLQADLSWRAFLKKAKGMLSDHASVEKSKAEKFGEAKHLDAIRELGEKQLEAMIPEDLRRFMHESYVEKVENAGGFEVWAKMDATEVAHRDLVQFQVLTERLGQTVYDSLDEDERAALDLFLWAGCCSHKDQNSFDGGNRAMMAAYSEFNMPKPVPLANKANAAFVARALDPSRGNKPLSKEEQDAVLATTHGGYKFANLVGMLCENKDDKRGLGDVYLNHMMSLYPDDAHRFSRVHNSRFQSVGEAAADIIQFYDGLVLLLGDVRDGKTKASLTNLEHNILKGLQDDATLSELCILLIYHNLVSSPYMSQVRGLGTDGLNALDLGPLHRDVVNHCQSIGDSADRFLEDLIDTNNSMEEISYRWSFGKHLNFVRPQAMEAAATFIRNRLDKEVVKCLLVAFFAGSKRTWERFSAEFASGGLIDHASAAQRLAAWMPATNDHNEGILGLLRRILRLYPRLGLHQFNSIHMWKFNHTDNFMWHSPLWADNDWEALKKSARERLASKPEQARRKAEAQHRKQVVEIHRKQMQERADKQDRKAEARVELLSKVVPFTAANVNDKVRNTDLDLQIDYRTQFDSTLRATPKGYYKVK
ncbi:hypothetical protein DL96DRAFT_1805498, partial [Flagelloscypha sp. PMI_526]